MNLILGVSAVARQTDDAERMMVDTMTRVQQTAQQFEARYPAAQLPLPLPQPLGDGVASMALAGDGDSGEATDDAASSAKRRKTSSWSGRECIVSTPVVRELMYHLTK